MTEQQVRFHRDGDGGYVTPDGRFIVRPWYNRTNSRPGSVGKREWQVIDTSGAEPFRGYRSPSASRTVYTVGDARIVIARVYKNEEN
jgi:hypothetical protein